ncbi:hypothetical protein F441_17530 [Phytophthora nicotianae CJ01A1]|uniref:Uncharacterized protein n=6 Tax=Phytophthora nicotianae TaxID=4792 RepID=V9ENC6_PHYNI|nr:hypothetical protein PPTG_21564 [Phytophthora nicotianae INRA-310]ETI36157.1 hypothetical protein F443_17662 [Phytophthora nicotianae P1569]ETM36268.1 hypothetical protein L914_17001 [Phytophthora nicotianae]ETO69121.1 hypothetical protein F444_14209 [Phytophthora nicotianae P1976]ETP05982.1 hypothetical protein F441_17530 [Phytophthora nicotianae CJ01A1]ETP34091.1 hypothetical protein F442_17516 [Phytophthora nicotianae P10297]
MAAPSCSKNDDGRPDAAGSDTTTVRRCWKSGDRRPELLKERRRLPELLKNGGRPPELL